MRRWNLSLSAALVVSLCVHAWAIHALMRRVNESPTQRLTRNTAPKPAARKNLTPVELIRLPAKPREPMPVESEQEFGQSDGRGQAINSMRGDQPMRAKEAPFEQAILSRQPGEHREGQIVRPKVASAAHTGSAPSGGNLGAAEKMLAALTPPTPAAAQMVGLQGNGSSQAAPPGEGPKHETESAKQRRGETAKNQVQRKAQIAAGNGGGAVAGQVGKSEPTLAGDPGEKSESESDAFSHVGNAMFQAGQLEARFGRKVKTVRPNFTLGGRMELANMFEPSVQLEVHADSEGKPTQVEVLQSSGSNSIDEPVRLALYQWWFEPPKNRHGQPMADVMVWTISFR